MALSLYLGFTVLSYFGLNVQHDLLNVSIQQVCVFKGPVRRSGLRSFTIHKILYIYNKYQRSV